MAAELDKEIIKIQAEIEKMAPNMKALEKYVAPVRFERPRLMTLPATKAR